MLVTGDVIDSVALGQCGAQTGQRLDLHHLKITPFNAFKFDANGVVIAIVLPQIMRSSGMPGAQIAIDKLIQIAIAPDKEVRGYFDTSELVEVRVRIAIERVSEKIKHLFPAKLARRQADGVDHDQVNIPANGAVAEIG